MRPASPKELYMEQVLREFAKLYRDPRTKDALSNIMPDCNKRLLYAALCLVDEAGEVGEKVKRVVRGDYGLSDPKVQTEIRLELGDVLYCMCMLCLEIWPGDDKALDHIVTMGLAKHKTRLLRGTIKGTGDDR